ncbi:MAG: carbamoyl phosphate synthase small subunit [Clostridium sp.]|nr:carbamoyl phosphate synthase small subunit [Clostridium sp.]
MKAFLILEDQTVFTGVHIGALREIISEIVFNTSMAGYLEVLTDPSYAGQAVCMTYPLIGNYGICKDDMESIRPWPDGFLVREISRVSSNFRSDAELSQFLTEHGIPGIAGIDTRRLTKILREKGTMNGMITTNADYNMEEVIPLLKAYRYDRVVEKVSCTKKYHVNPTRILEENGPLAGMARFDQEQYANGAREKRPSMVKELTGIRENGEPLKIALMDLGAKHNIIDSLTSRGCAVTVYPAWTSAQEILADAPDGIMLSNGPGDPADATSIIKEIQKLANSGVPIFAICLGHQLMALAMGAKTHKLKYGHRGGNHPVKDLRSGRVYITSQNHGYVVDTTQLDASIAQPSFMNVNDGTNEGLTYIGRPITTVQFHPEACPGPQDSAFLFDQFLTALRAAKADDTN